MNNKYKLVMKILKESSPVHTNYQNRIDVRAALLTAKILLNTMGRKDLAEKIDEIHKDI
jgi:hypothetical protein